MNFRFPRLLLALCATVFSFAGCSLFEPGGPVAAITVKARTGSQVTDVVERVFIDNGYRPYRRALDGTVFEKASNKADRLLYGDWGNGEGLVTERVKVTVASAREDHYRVRCVPFIVREAHDAAFEDEHRRMQLTSPTLGRLLREVKQQCEELWLSRDPMAAEVSN